MVRTSERKSIINTLEQSIKNDMTNLALDLILDSDTSEEDKSEDEDEDENDWIDDIEEKSILLAAVQHQRYLKPRA